MRSRFSAFALLIIAAACSSPPPAPQPAPAPAPAAAPAAPSRPVIVQPTGPWIDWTISPGSWVYRRDARGSIALFGVPGTDALVTLRCDQARGRIYLTRADQAGSGGSGSITIRSSSAMKQFSASATGATPPYIAAEIMPGDSILDAMAYTRGRIALEVSGQQSIAIPVWSELPRIIDDCRS